MSTKWLRPLCLLPLIAHSAPASAAVLWKGDFETGDVSQWDSSIALETNGRKNLVFVTDSVADGKQAAKITLMDDIIFQPYEQSRVEVKHIGLHTQNGEDSYYAWSFMVPADAEIRSNIGYWESTPTSLNTMTFYIEPGDNGGTDVVFGTGNLGETERWRTKLALNVWHRFAIHNHWSQSQADGKVDVWYDGQQVVTGATATKRDANKLFFQMGLHRSDPSPPIQTIFIDAAIEADSQADILAPLPPPLGAGGAGGAGGTGGVGGVGGLGGSAGADPGGASGAGGGGSSGLGGSGGSGLGGAGAPSAGQATGGAPTAGGAPGGMAGGGASTTPPIMNGATEDSGGCALAPSHHAARGAWLALLGAALLRARRSRRRQHS
jgi:hypothetical protein